MNIYDLVYKFVDENKGTYLLYVFILIVIYGADSVIIPKLISNLMSFVNQSKIDIEQVSKSFYMIILVWAVSQVFYIGDDLIRSEINPKFDEYVSSTIMKSLILNNQEDYEELDQGLIVSKLLMIPKILKQLSKDTLQFFIPKLLVAIIIASYFFYINKKLGLVCIVLVILHYQVFINNQQACRKIVLDYNQDYEELTKVIGDKIQNLPSIYSLGKEKDEINLIQDRNKKYHQISSSVLKCNTKFKAIGYIINILFFTVINYLNLDSFTKKETQASDFTTVIIVSTFLMSTLVEISNHLPELQYNLGLLEGNQDFLKVLDTKIDDDKHPSLEWKKGVIEFRNVSFRYNESKNVLQNINLVIPEKGKIAILGKSGSGKSTLIKVLLRYFKPTSGQILIDGQSIHEVTINSYRKNFSYVNQNTKLFNVSIYENIRYGNNVDKVHIDNLLNRFNLMSIFKNVDYNLETPCGLNGEQLSGGQKQIVLILRAYFNNKPIVILDEPISAIDSTNKSQVIRLIEEITKDKTVIIITHDNSILGIVNKIYRIDNGVLQS